MYENQIHRHESSSQRTSSSAMKKQLSNSTMHGSAGTEIIAKESSHQTYTRYVSKMHRKLNNKKCYFLFVKRLNLYNDFYFSMY